MKEQIGWRGFIDNVKIEAPRYSKLLPQLPRLAHQALTKAVETERRTDELLARMLIEQRRTNTMLSILMYFGGGLLGGGLLMLAFFAFVG
jgi:ubiquinone biosynthesis protein